MALAEVEDPRPYGVAALGEGDRITGFVEKPAPENAPSHWINAGVSVWRREVIERIPADRPSSFEQEVIPFLVDRGLYGFRLSGYWDDAGTPERLLRSQKLLFDAGRGGKGGLPPGAFGNGPVAVMPGATATGASFGKYVTLGPGAVVEAGAHVENSVLMDNVHVEKEATVIGSILGPHCRVRAGHRVSGQVLGERGEA
jgi:mannose-1-phosphate guanylyltransferase